MTSPTQVSLTRLEEIVGSEFVSADNAEIAARQVDGTNPSVVVQPADVSQVAEIVRFAAAEKFSVIPCGGRTKLGIGSPPARYDISLDLSRMNRVLAYDPHDLTLGVEPGMRMQDLAGALAEQKQFLPLAVPFADRATIGGVVAANSSSPLRHAYGSVRDFCLGIEFVTGEGVVAKSGGRVVKNVTGYDLHKLLIGSLGTLAIITRINFRTFPLPSAKGTFIATFPDENSGFEAAFGFCRAIAHSVLSPLFVEVLDSGAAQFLFSSHIPARIKSPAWAVVVAAAGHPEVVDRCGRELGHMAGISLAEEFVRLDDSEADSVFLNICEFPRLILESVRSAAIFRIGVIPTAMASIAGELSKLARQNNLDLVTLTRASGIMYAALLPREGETPSIAAISRAVQEVFQVCVKPGIDASAILECCPVEVKAAIGSVWGPSRPEFALMQRVQRAFDPNGVLGPGRFAISN